MIKHEDIIGIVQLNPILGNVEYNAKNIAKYIKKAEELDINLLVFPEYSLCGAPLNNILTHYPIITKNIQHWLNGLAKLTNKITVLVGLVDSQQINNSAIAVLRNGKIDSILSEKNNINIIEVGTHKYGIIIGEKNINNIKTEKLKKLNLKTIINCIATYSTINKLDERKKILHKISFTHNIPIIQINQVGAIDDFSFDGNSLIYGINGNLIKKAKAFSEDFITINTSELYTNNNSDKTINNNKVFNLNYELDLERTYNLIIQGIYDYFNKNGLKRAVLGLSGGLDSSICAVLLADALGKENVFGISLPTNLTSLESKSDAKTLAMNLGINYYEAPIINMINKINDEFETLFSNIEHSWNVRYDKSFTQDNIQARTRALYLWCISNEFESCIPIATSDKSELYMGYATINGDMSGGLAPIGDVTKTKLFALARWLNKNRLIKNAIPESIILKKPGAELAIDPKTGKTLNAEDALMPYEFLDEIIWKIENENATYEALLNSKFLYEINNSITTEQKVEWLNKFYSKKANALYKWSILPPCIITDDKTINKNLYKQAITSKNVFYKEYSKEYIVNNL